MFPITHSCVTSPAADSFLCRTSCDVIRWQKASTSSVKGPYWNYRWKLPAACGQSHLSPHHSLNPQLDHIPHCWYRTRMDRAHTNAVWGSFAPHRTSTQPLPCSEASPHLEPLGSLGHPRYPPAGAEELLAALRGAGKATALRLPVPPGGCFRWLSCSGFFSPPFCRRSRKGEALGGALLPLPQAAPPRAAAERGCWAGEWRGGPASRLSHFHPFGAV